MNNIKVIYLYRDAGNYKKWAEVVFSNPEGLPPEAVTKTLSDALLPDGLFIADQVRLPEAFLFTEGNATSDDHCFHEFALAELTLEDPNDSRTRTISQFMKEVEREAKQGWTPFDPHEKLHQKISD
jgi:hypothetical protein